MTTFECVNCNTVIDCATCGTKYCPKCGKAMITSTGKKNNIKGVCGKCNHSLYLAKVNDIVIYRCNKLMVQLDKPLIDCIAI